jgi:hypothetical protein
VQPLTNGHDTVAGKIDFHGCIEPSGFGAMRMSSNPSRFALSGS